MEELNPKVKISDLDMAVFPLYNFHIVIVVEPDPETWMVARGDQKKFSKLIEKYSDLISQELWGIDDEATSEIPKAEDVKETLVIMATEGQTIVSFKPMVEWSPFIVQSPEDYEFKRLRVLLDGIKQNYSAWNRIAIVGGVYDDEIVRAANAVQAAGFETTIVTRYCLFQNVFINIDDALEAIGKRRRSGKPDNGE